MGKSQNNKTLIQACVLLSILTAIVYWQTFSNGFVKYDDCDYVTKNAHVKAGISIGNVYWALTTGHAANWHPLTWLSHMLDVSLFGLDPMGHHLTSLLLHIINTLLLFILLYRMTGYTGRSVFIAALFAVHPTHVESVAWVSERKDVLSTFFMLLTLLAYHRYTVSPSVRKYVSAAVLFILGLMSKPMLVTLPILMLLLDFWPLGRMSKIGWGKLVVEKLPFAAIALASCVVTFLVQKKGGAMSSLEFFSLGVRAANAVVSYIRYILKMFWPVKLSVFYPHPGPSLPVWQVIASIVLLMLITAAVIYLRRNRPYLLWGWLWYVVMLIPVIGLVQVGGQAMADRYTYVPYTGLFVALTWLAADLYSARSKTSAKSSEKAGKRLQTADNHGSLVPLWGLSVMLILASAVLCRGQVSHWQNNMTLFEHAAEVDPRNHLARNNIGFDLAQEGRYDEAVEWYKKALEIKPDYAETHNNLGNALSKAGDIEGAVSAYRQVVKLRPDKAVAYYNLAGALLALGETDEAIATYKKALKINPRYAEVRSNLAGIYIQQKNLDQAISECRKAIKLKPKLGDAHNNLAVALYFKGDYTGAWRAVKQAEKCGWTMNPGFLASLAEKMKESE